MNKTAKEVTITFTEEQFAALVDRSSYVYNKLRPQAREWVRLLDGPQGNSQAWTEAWDNIFRAANVKEII